MTDILQQDSAYSNDLTQWLLSVLKSENDVVRYSWWMMMNDSSLFRWRWNSVHVMFCDVVNYNDVTSTTDSLEFIKDKRFTDVQIVENIVV